MDKFGRVVIPKSIREALNLKSEVKLEVRVSDGEITLRPQAQGQVVEKNGFYVWTGADRLDKTLVELIQETREERQE